MCSGMDNTTLLVLSSLIRISAGLKIFAPHRSFSQLVTSFFGAMYQGIHLNALCSLIFFFLFYSTFAIFLSFRLLPYKKNSITLTRLIFNSYSSKFPLKFEVYFFFVLTKINLFKIAFCTCFFLSMQLSIFVTRRKSGAFFLNLR